LQNRVALARRDAQRQSERLRPELVMAQQNRASKDLSDIMRRFTNAGATQLDRQRSRLDALERMRETLGYRATLARGYTVVRGDGVVVTTARAAKAATVLDVEFADGRMSFAGKPTKATSTVKKQTPPGKQGDLF